MIIYLLLLSLFFYLLYTTNYINIRFLIVCYTGLIMVVLFKSMRENYTIPDYYPTENPIKWFEKSTETNTITNFKFNLGAVLSNELINSSIPSRKLIPLYVDTSTVNSEHCDKENKNDITVLGDSNRRYKAIDGILFDRNHFKERGLVRRQEQNLVISDIKNILLMSGFRCKLVELDFISPRLERVGDKLIPYSYIEGTNEKVYHVVLDNQKLINDVRITDTKMFKKKKWAFADINKVGIINKFIGKPIPSMSLNSYMKENAISGRNTTLDTAKKINQNKNKPTQVINKETILSPHVYENAVDPKKFKAWHSKKLTELMKNNPSKDIATLFNSDDIEQVKNIYSKQLFYAIKQYNFKPYGNRPVTVTLFGHQFVKLNYKAFKTLPQIETKTSGNHRGIGNVSAKFLRTVDSEKTYQWERAPTDFWWEKYVNTESDHTYDEVGKSQRNPKHFNLKETNPNQNRLDKAKT